MIYALNSPLLHFPVSALSADTILERYFRPSFRKKLPKCTSGKLEVFYKSTKKNHIALEVLEKIFKLNFPLKRHYFVQNIIENGEDLPRI